MKTHLATFLPMAYTEEEAADVYEQAIVILTKLSQTRHRLSRLKFRLMQGFLSWTFVLVISLFFSAPIIYSHIVKSRETEYVINTVELILTVVTVTSAIQCITLGTALFKVNYTLARASRNFYSLSDSLNSLERSANFL